MAFFKRIFLSIIIVLSLLILSEFETAIGQPETEDCLDCHQDESLSLEKEDGRRVSLYVDEEQFKSSIHGKIACYLCHSDIREVPHREGGLAKVNCGSCHPEEATSFRDSIHQIPLGRGDVFAPACKNCHGKHHILSTKDPESSVYRENVLFMCGGCHVGIASRYRESIHAQLMEKGDKRTPACPDCHTSHHISASHGALYRLIVINRCGNCHEKYFKTFRDTYHGKITSLGEVKGAKCYDCHGSHRIFAEEDVRSSIHPINRVKTCRKCHPKAPENYVSFIAHLDKNKKGEHVLLGFSEFFMIGILYIVLGCFGFHSLLWLVRSFIKSPSSKVKK
jgi:hypothetical protein